MPAFLSFSNSRVLEDKFPVNVLGRLAAYFLHSASLRGHRLYPQSFFPILLTPGEPKWDLPLPSSSAWDSDSEFPMCPLWTVQEVSVKESLNPDSVWLLHHPRGMTAPFASLYPEAKWKTTLSFRLLVTQSQDGELLLGRLRLNLWTGREHSGT